MHDVKDRFLHSPCRVYGFADSVAMGRTLLDAGARIIQLRNKTVSDQAFRRMAAELLAYVRRLEDALLIVNDRVEIAAAIGAHGVHVGQADLACADVVQKVPETMLIGVSARYPEVARRAAGEGADYVGTGSVYATGTKPEATVIGLQGLRAVVEAVPIPVVAIGGISAVNIRSVLDQGARYAAVIGAITAAPDPASAYREMEAAAAPTG